LKWVFSKDDLAVIVACFAEEEWTGTRIAKEFPNRKWNLSMKEGVNHLRILKIFRLLSETNGTMSMTRQSEKLCCSGKGIQQLWQSRIEDLFSTFSADQLTDANHCDVLV